MDANERPLILSLNLNQEAADFFNALRKKYFPPERNYLKAHLTLFHALPAELLPEVKSYLRELADSTRIFDLEKMGWKSIGRGVAYVFQSEELQRLHKELQQEWEEQLSRQDQQKLWPHITIQNKVSGKEAKETLALVQELKPPKVTAEGLDLWFYDGGPWEFIASFPFRK